jgi:formate/nitrite transporter FocA (FNT family)
LVLFNKFALPIIVHAVVDKEKWSTKTKMNISFGIKLTLVLFCNTALITLAVEVLTFENYYGTGGMIGTESMVFILNAIVPPLAWLINPWYMSRKREREQ